ncbi:unnamed protein product, partial [Ceratitis capitata]
LMMTPPICVATCRWRICAIWIITWLQCCNSQHNNINMAHTIYAVAIARPPPSPWSRHAFRHTAATALRVTSPAPASGQLSQCNDVVPHQSITNASGGANNHLNYPPLDAAGSADQSGSTRNSPSMNSSDYSIQCIKWWRRVIGKRRCTTPSSPPSASAFVTPPSSVTKLAVHLRRHCRRRTTVTNNIWPHLQHTPGTGTGAGTTGAKIRQIIVANIG